MKLITVMALLLVPGIALADKADKAAKADKTDETLAQLKVAAKCDDPASLWRVWCSAAAYATGQPAALPGKPLVGLSLELKFGGDAREELSSSVSLSALAVDKSGKVKLTNVKPTSKAEETMSAEAVMGLAVYFKGKAPTAKLPADLSGYVGSLTGEYATSKTKTEWTWKGATPSTMRKVGSVWVVIEHPEGGIIATILTDKWE